MTLSKMSKESEALVVCTNKLKISIREPLTKGFNYIYSIAEQITLKDEKENGKIKIGFFTNKNMVLYNFQTLLKKIPSWNQETINKETNRLLVGTPELKNIMCAIFIAIAKVLSNIKVSEEKEDTFTLTLPQLSRFIHKIYEKVAKNIYSNPYIFLKDVSLEQKRHNQHVLQDYIDNGIDVAIMDILPTDIIEELLASNEDVGSDIGSIYSALSDRNISRRSTIVDSDQEDEEEEEEGEEDIFRRRSSIGSVFSRKNSNRSEESESNEKQIDWLPQNNFIPDKPSRTNEDEGYTSPIEEDEEDNIKWKNMDYDEQNTFQRPQSPIQSVDDSDDIDNDSIVNLTPINEHHDEEEEKEPAQMEEPHYVEPVNYDPPVSDNDNGSSHEHVQEEKNEEDNWGFGLSGLLSGVPNSESDNNIEEEIEEQGNKMYDFSKIETPEEEEQKENNFSLNSYN